MFAHESPDQIIQNQEKQIQELEIRLNTLQMHMDKLYQEIGISREELDQAFQKSENFSPEEWKEVQIQKKAADLKLNGAKPNLSSPKETSATREQLSELKRHWIFVR